MAQYPSLGLTTPDGGGQASDFNLSDRNMPEGISQKQHK